MGIGHWIGGDWTVDWWGYDCGLMGIGQWIVGDRNVD